MPVAADLQITRQAAIIEGGGVKVLLDLVTGGPWKEAASQSLLLLAVLAGSSPGDGPDRLHGKNSAMLQYASTASVLNRCYYCWSIMK